MALATYTAHRRGCAGCGLTFLGDDRQGAYICGKCRTNARPYDPQPRDIVRLADGKRYAVRARVGHELAVRQLGFPGSRTFDVPVSVTLPD